MRSDLMKKGLERAPHRSLFKAMGYTDEEIERPLIGVVNSANEIIPGHIHLDLITQDVKAGIRMAGGTPVEFPVIGVCDGIAMGHAGMKYSLASRELIADSIEIMAMAHPFDALVFIPNCDKIIPGMLMAALRLNIPSIFISGGPMLAGEMEGKAVDLISVFEGVGAVKAKKMTEASLKQLEDCACPGLRILLRHVYRQFHELRYGSSGAGASRKRHDSGGSCGAPEARQTRRNENNGTAQKERQAAGYRHTGRF